MMGFYPKHLRQRRHGRNMRMIATAALSGCIFVRATPSTHVVPAPCWFIRYDDGKESHTYPTKGEAAAVYLVWWLMKKNMWPRYR